MDLPTVARLIGLPGSEDAMDTLARLLPTRPPRARERAGHPSGPGPLSYRAPDRGAGDHGGLPVHDRRSA